LGEFFTNSSGHLSCVITAEGVKKTEKSDRNRELKVTKKLFTNNQQNQNQIKKKYFWKSFENSNNM
jgi:hypothetical protein